MLQLTLEGGQPLAEPSGDDQPFAASAALSFDRRSTGALSILVAGQLRDSGLVTRMAAIGRAVDSGGAVQRRGGGKVERVAGVPQAATDLATVEKPWAWAGV